MMFCQEAPRHATSAGAPGLRAGSEADLPIVDVDERSNAGSTVVFLGLRVLGGRFPTRAAKTRCPVLLCFGIRSRGRVPAQLPGPVPLFPKARPWPVETPHSAFQTASLKRVSSARLRMTAPSCSATPQNLRSSHSTRNRLCPGDAYERRGCEKRAALVVSNHDIALITREKGARYVQFPLVC